MTIYDTILWLESKSTKKRFPTVLFSGDTDMVTAGWASLTSTVGHEVVVTRLTSDEFKATITDPSAYELFERRINLALSRNDLRVPWLTQVIQQSSATGLSFQEFRKVYRPPRLLYRDVLASDSLAEEISRVSLADFEANGGRLVAYEA